jgi:hypothetical protein
MTKPFARFARKARIREADLWEAARLANAGAIDADLGGGVIKQRIARAGEGKSGGTRSIILFRFKGRAVFVFGFEKKDLGNIKTNELEAFRELADLLLGYSDAGDYKASCQRRANRNTSAGGGQKWPISIVAM